MKTLNFLRLFLTSRHFRSTLRRTLEYAAASHSVQFGSGAADVIIFMGHYGEKVFDDRFRLEISRMRESIMEMQEENLNKNRVEWTRAMQSYLEKKGVDLNK